MLAATSLFGSPQAWPCASTHVFAAALNYFSMLNHQETQAKCIASCQLCAPNRFSVRSDKLTAWTQGKRGTAGQAREASSQIGLGWQRTGSSDFSRLEILVNNLLSFQWWECIWTMYMHDLYTYPEQKLSKKYQLKRYTLKKTYAIWELVDPQVGPKW